ncbi:hypothetical protein [Paraburkholderia sp. J67]|uniref:hypothetical protein n=1 Tax=Paraburkholderia sp. J67 TaxID=2805435 RepID=UPI002ABDB7B9|nr:hypothetical protein [Paraburkholderia sp. J67]
MNIDVLEELWRELGPMLLAFEKQHGCKPTVAIVPATLMRRLVGPVPNCVVYVSNLVVLADPTVDVPRLTALEIPDPIRASPSKPAPDTSTLH